MKRTFSWLVAPALALTILVTTPTLWASGRKGSNLSGRSTGSGNTQNRQFTPINLGSKGIQSKPGVGIHLPSQNGNYGNVSRITKKPNFGIVTPPNGLHPKSVPYIPPKSPPIFKPTPIPFPGSGGGKGCGNGHHHGHHCNWPTHWHCHNWNWGYGFQCPQVVPCQLPTVTYIPAPVTVIEIQTGSVDDLFSSLSAVGIDLVVSQIMVAEAGNAEHGPLLQVTIFNQGQSDLTIPTRVALLALQDAPPTSDSPRAMETVKALKSGESTRVEVRLPASATAMPRLLVAVEIPKDVVDVNEQNNVVQGEFSQIPTTTTAMK